MVSVEVGIAQALKGIEKALISRYEKAIDLSDSLYILIAPTSTDFNLLSQILSREIRMIESVILINDGAEGDGLGDFKGKIAAINGQEAISEVALTERLDQISLIAFLSGILDVIRESGERRGFLIVCSGPYKIDLFHLALYLDARAIELTEEGFRELVSYPTWKLSEVSLSILYVAMKLEQIGEKVTPQALARYVKLREKGEGKGDLRSKLVSLDYHVKKYLETQGLLRKERDPDSKRGITYRLTKKGLSVAKLVETHFRSLGLKMSEFVELENLDQFAEVKVE